MAEERRAVNNSETDEIRSEIERTRVEMSETLGEIQDRLRPDHLLQQARDGVTEAAAGKVRNIMASAGETAQTVATRARDTGNYLTRYAQEHPIRVAVTIGALTWWMLRNRDTSDVWYGDRDTSWEDSDAMSYGESRSLRSRVSSARDTVGEYAASARDTVNEYATSAREAAGQYAASARETAAEYAESARLRAQRMSAATGDWVTENPMAAGAIALAVGAAIGMSLPSTEYEDRMMGDKRDLAWERATRAAQDLKANVTQRVQNVAKVAQDLANDSLLGAEGTSNNPQGSSTEQTGSV